VALSLEIYAFLSKDRVPDRLRWQQSIVGTGLPLELDPELDVASNRGFSPCVLNGEQSGFEIHLDHSQEIPLAPDVALAVGDRDRVITFRWGGDLKECACVLGAATALVKDFDAVGYFPNDDIIYVDFKTLLDEAHQCLDMVGDPDL
jgi:hypothetical protein